MSLSPIAPLSAIAHARRRLLARCGVGGTAVLILVLAAAAGGAAFLLGNESPWESGVIEKIRAEETLTIKDTISAGLWLGAAINLVLALGLLASARWWTRPLESPRLSAATPTVAGAPLPGRLFWILTLLAVIVGGWLRAPKLEHSLWNDEEQAFRKFTWGEYEPAAAPKQGQNIARQTDPDALVFDPAGWDRALFYSVNGNNHVVHTVAARVCHSVWRFFAQPETETFREPVIRLEPYLSGLIAIVALALWLRILGFPLAGVTAAWAFALHPWVLRYGAEARGYAAMLLLIILAFLCLTLALRTGRWRWWLAYGLAQSLYLLCFAGAVYLAVAMNLIAGALLLHRRDPRSLWRWGVSCLLGAMLFLQIMTATVLRIWSWIQAPHVEPFPMDAAYFRDFWGHLSIGAPWSSAHPDRQFGLDVSQLAADSPAWSVAFHLILPMLLVTGLVVALMKSPPARWILGVFAGTALLIWLHNSRSELAFYGWYALYFSLAFVIALGFVPEALAQARTLGQSRSRPSLAFGLGGFLLVTLFYGGLGREPLWVQRQHDRHPMRQAVVAVRGEAPAIDARHAAHLTGAIGSGANQLRTYDPRVRWIKTPAELDTLLAEAREAGKPLTLYLCGPQQLALAHPELSARLADSGQFEPGFYFPGIEEFWSFQILRWRAPTGD